MSIHLATAKLNHHRWSHRTLLAFTIVCFGFLFFVVLKPAREQQHDIHGDIEAESISRANSWMSSSSGKANATFFALARNSDLYEVLSSIQAVEDRFNHKYHYDWVFLNDDKFSDDFVERTTALVSGGSSYGMIPKEHWGFPDWIDLEKAAKTRESMKQRKVIYGDSISYRHMCRYESGFFAQHDLLKQYRWYWRVEPGIKLHCHVDYDVFRFMEENDKKYGFVISLYEYAETIETLWSSVKKFLELRPQELAPDNAMDFVSEDKGASYNKCHFWSNFEVADLDWFRSDQYSRFFKFLDHEGGFFYERWGDAPVHSIAASLMLNKSQIHFFDDIGYWHNPFSHCPNDAQKRLEGRCICNPKDSFDWNGYSCLNKWYKMMNSTEKSPNASSP